MKILKENVLLAFLLSFILFTSIATADHKPTTEYEGLEWSQLPVICGPTNAVNEYLTHNEFILENLSVGKENAQEWGQPVYMVSYFYNKEKKQSMSVITAPSGLESCMLYRSFDLVFPGTAL